uniref:VPS33B late endosome and lysosome associated n=1 Tax=Phasianus colchicus TaxID=9054 RepID=A0A669PHD8_PHACC
MGSDAARLLEAADFAAWKHREQRRKDPEGTPYINHPIGVARILSHEAGVTDVVVLQAALLHDTVEDTDTTLPEIEERFGPEVRRVVEELTDDKALPKAERKRLQGGRRSACRSTSGGRRKWWPACAGRARRWRRRCGGCWRSAAWRWGRERGNKCGGCWRSAAWRWGRERGNKCGGCRLTSPSWLLRALPARGHVTVGASGAPIPVVPVGSGGTAASRRRSGPHDGSAMASTARRDAPEPPDFGILKRLARDQLIYLLEQLPGRKDLFIEPDLMSPLDRIANVSVLKQHEVDKLYRVENRPAPSTSDQLCFLVRPRVRTMRYIAGTLGRSGCGVWVVSCCTDCNFALPVPSNPCRPLFLGWKMSLFPDIVNADKMSGRSRKYKIIFSPQKFYACEMVLEEEGVFGDVTCDEWSFYLLPLDEDIISMELPEFFRDYFLEGDHRWINSVARALQLLNSLYGPFSRAYGIGRCAKMSYELWRDLEEESESDGQGRKPEIGNIFLMDRDTDYVTALCSQVVYEGLVDDTFRIKCGSVDFGPEVTSSDKSIKVLLNAQDKIFSQIRNEHFSSVFGFLSQKSRNLQAQYDRRQGMDIKQMKNFVSQELKGLKQEHRLLSLHIGACESIMKKKTKQDFQEMIKVEHALLEGFDIRESTSFIEEHIDRQVSPIESLRLMCLLSITENGLIPKDYRSLKTQYLQSYGPEHLLTFHNLKHIGLLTEQAAGETLTAMESRVSRLVTDRAAGKITDAFNSLAKKSNFRAISKKLSLIPRVDGEYNLKMPRDMAYVFSGAYTPLSCKIIEQVLERRGWQGLEEAVRLLNGNEFAMADGAPEEGAGGDAQRVVLALFLGGCTFSEIAALRFLGKERGCRFIFLTTAITSSARMMEAMAEAKA